MRLREINAQLEELLDQVDPDTGELLCDAEQIEALMIAREEKLEGLALAIINYKSDIAALKKEEKRLADLRKTAENKADKCKAFLMDQLHGEKLSTEYVKAYYRRSESVELAPEFMAWAKENNCYLRWQEPEPDKEAIGKELKSGGSIPGAELISKTNLIIR